MHFPKDPTQGEDQQVLRKGNAPSNLSLLRSMVLILLSPIDIPDLVSQTFPRKMAYFSGNVERAVQMLGGETENWKLLFSRPSAIFLLTLRAAWGS